jgi:hypothetical protein
MIWILADDQFVINAEKIHSFYWQSRKTSGEITLNIYAEINIGGPNSPAQYKVYSKKILTGPGTEMQDRVKISPHSTSKSPELWIWADRDTDAIIGRLGREIIADIVAVISRISRENADQILDFYQLFCNRQ